MPEGVGLVNIGIVVDEILVAGVVWRINVDEVYLTAMRLLQEFQGGEVVSLYQEIEAPRLL